MGNMLLVIFFSFIFPAVNCLLCLQCSGIIQPRHCKTVLECDVGQKCGVERISFSNGQQLYNVGCFLMQECSGNITASGECRECCGKTLCNAQGCGEPGYPETMGPICYNCPVPTIANSCSSIEFCEVGQVCEYDFRREFGDFVYTGQCAHRQTCNYNSANWSGIIGRDLDQRSSVVEHLCHGCCDFDLCNKQCNAHTIKIPTDCYDLHKQNQGLPSGVYNVSLWRNHFLIPVFCDMTTASGGWTVIQHRYDGSVDFYRNLSEYTDGFGNVGTEFWLGLSYMKEIADKGNTTIRMEVSAADGSSANEEWPEFRLGDAPTYTLHVGGRGIGTAGDSVRYFEQGNNGSDFTATESYCGDIQHGAWWHNSYCTYINLNGEYATPGTRSRYDNGWGGMVYFSFKDKSSLKMSTIMLRRND